MSDPVESSVQSLVDDAFEAGRLHGYNEGICQVLDGVLRSAQEVAAPTSGQLVSVTTRLEDLGLSVRLYNLLHREGVRRLLDLYLLCRSGGLGEIRNLSDRDVAQLSAALETHGYPIGVFGF